METQDKIFKHYKDAARKTEDKPFASMDKIWGRIEEKLDEGKEQKVIPFRKISIAAAVVLLLSLGSFYVYHNMHFATVVQPMIATKDLNLPKLQELPDTGGDLPVRQAEEAVERKSSLPIAKHSTVPTKNTTYNKPRIVRGILKDEQGEALTGVSINITGTNMGTVSDLDGKYELKITGDKKNIEISASGYEKLKIDINSHDTLLAVNLKPSSQVLSDVVITTVYGQHTTKEKYVGATDVITAKKIKQTPVTDIGKVIEGTAPGVLVINGSGQPGSGTDIQIRGNGSLDKGTTPLIVVDGDIFNGDLSAIKPQDVENMSILKDAASTSLYGARGANGTIVIITKKGAKHYVGGRKDSGVKRTFKKIKKWFTPKMEADSVKVIKEAVPAIEKEEH